VYIEDGVTIRDATVGPNVTVEAGSSIVGSRVSDSILGRDVRLDDATVRECVIGDGEVLEGRELVRCVVDGGEVAPAR
jgi:glucose-1-phosphate thymidylyltransferase